MLPHEGDFVSGTVEPTAMVLNNPLVVAAGTWTSEQPALFTFASAEPVEVDAIKLSEDRRALILRLHEYTGQEMAVTVTPQFAYNEMASVALDEVAQAAPLTKQPELQLTLTPYQIKTLRFELPSAN